MKKITKQSFNLTLTLLLIGGNCFMYGKVDSVSHSQPGLSLREARIMRFQNPDSSIRMYQWLHMHALQAHDTLTAVDALMGLAGVYGHQAGYKKSYDQLWTALLLADAAQLDLSSASVHRAIGRYYSFFNRKEKALSFLGLSLALKKKLVEKGELKKGRLAQNYHSFCATFRELGDSESGKIYLDSSFMYYSPTTSKINLSFLKFEQAVLLNTDGKHQEALKIFEEILPWFSENNPGYQVLVYNYVGDTYMKMANFPESERYYNKALEMSRLYNSHLDFTPLIYERLASLYDFQKDYNRAYQSLRKAKELDATFFDSRSETNRPLLEIQDAFRKEREAQENLRKEHRLAQLEQEENIMFLQRIMMAGIVGFLVLFGILYANYVKSKHQAEKQLIQKKRELEIQKTNEIVELKNKELAASVLKLIEKETFIDTLKDKLSQDNGDLKRHEIVQVIRSMSSSSTESWKEFEARFISVNKSFYDRLSTKFPKLTQGDLKLCALVKLNFSSKEMAKLLGISVESVHTTRSRLRKKLNLSRDMNLKEFIANI